MSGPFRARSDEDRLGLPRSLHIRSVITVTSVPVSMCRFTGFVSSISDTVHGSLLVPFWSCTEPRKALSRSSSSWIPPTLAALHTACCSFSLVALPAGGVSCRATLLVMGRIFATPGAFLAATRLFVTCGSTVVTALTVFPFVYTAHGC